MNAHLLKNFIGKTIAEVDDTGHEIKFTDGSALYMTAEETLDSAEICFFDDYEQYNRW